MDCTIEENKIKVSFPFNAEIINKVKAAGMKWNPKEKLWDSPFSYHVIDGLSRSFPELNLPVPELPSCNGWEPSAYLMDHQKEAAKIALEYPRYGFFDSTGTGKTIAAIEIIKQKRLKTLVICPLSLIENAWIKDVNRFAPELKILNLWEVIKKRKKIPEHDIGIINFESFKNNISKFTDYQMVIIDESSKCKSYKSDITKKVISYTDGVPFVYLLSGTPAPNGLLEYFPQLRIIDQSLLGRSFYSFRNKFCFSTGFGGYKWEMRSDMKEEFLELIGKKSRVILKEDVLDLPERVFNIRTVYLDDKEKAAYKKMEDDMILEVENQTSIAANSAVKIMKLREATSGFFLDENGKAIITGNSKLIVLKELLEEIGDNQVVIWENYHVEGDQICEMLGSNFVRVDGTISSQDKKNESVKAFINKEVKYLVSHPASLSHGITLTNCSFMVYFSLNFSYEQLHQSRDRIYRYGTINRCSYYTLIAKGTVDESIHRALENKESVVDSVFSYLKRNRG